MKKIPYPVQQTYSRESWYQNTPVSVPAPPPSGLPAPCWIGGTVRTSWTNNRADMPAPVQVLFDDGKINWFAEWSSPIFDLKPMLQAYTGNGRSGRNFTTQRAVPVWVGGLMFACTSGVLHYHQSPCARQVLTRILFEP